MCLKSHSLFYTHDLGYHSNQFWSKIFLKIKYYSVDTTMFSNLFFLTTKSWKNTLESCSEIFNFSCLNGLNRRIHFSKCGLLSGWFTNLQWAPFEFEGSCNKSWFRIPDFFDHGYTPRNFEFFQLVFFAMCLKFTENSICQIFVRALGIKIQAGFVKFFCQFS